MSNRVCNILNRQEKLGDLSEKLTLRTLFFMIEEAANRAFNAWDTYYHATFGAAVNRITGGKRRAFLSRA